MATKYMVLANALTGGADGALDAWDCTSMPDGSLALVDTGSIVYHYTYDSGSSTAESAPFVVAPDTGTGRWLLTGVSDASTLYIDGSGNVGVGTTSPLAKFHIVDNENIRVSSNETAATNKYGAVLVSQYDSATETEGYLAMFTQSLETSNTVYIGGGSTGYNAATSLRFFTAADVSTRQGTARMTISSAGLVNVVGEITAGTKTFLIDHPVEPTEKTLTHAVFEGPEHGLIYRGKTKLVNGKATINFDDYFGMTAGTFKALTQDVTVQSLQNQDGFDRCRPSNVTDNSFDIICENASSTDEIAWVVMAARADRLVKFSSQNDSDGRLILENDKPEPTAEELKSLEPEVIETKDASKADTEEVITVTDLNNCKGYYRNFEAFGAEQPTKVKTYKMGKGKSK